MGRRACAAPSSASPPHPTRREVEHVEPPCSPSHEARDFSRWWFWCHRDHRQHVSPRTDRHRAGPHPDPGSSAFRLKYHLGRRHAVGKSADRASPRRHRLQRSPCGNDFNNRSRSSTSSASNHRDNVPYFHFELPAHGQSVRCRHTYRHEPCRFRCQHSCFRDGALRWPRQDRLRMGDSLSSRFSSRPCCSCSCSPLPAL